MSHAAAAPAVGSEEVVAPAVEGGTSTTFPELVWAHWLWERRLHEDRRVDERLEQRYRRALAEFERREGRVLSAYWSTPHASAVAITVKPLAWPLRLLGFDAHIRFHRVSDWVTEELPELADVFHRCDVLAVKVGEVLRGTSERIAMQWLLAVSSHLLGCVERTRDDPPEERRAAAVSVAASQQKELDELEKYYQRAADRGSRITYSSGMIVGVVVSAALAALVAVLFEAFSLNADSRALKAFFACYAAGALGAVVSVLSRMAGVRGSSFGVDSEVGRRKIMRLGGYRPFLGAIFGLATYFALQSGLLQVKTPQEDKTSFYFFTVLAFLAGFSERLTAVVLGSAESVVAGEPSEGQLEPQPPEMRRRETVS
jgi:hypothetical protein